MGSNNQNLNEMLREEVIAFLVMSWIDVGQFGSPAEPLDFPPFLVFFIFSFYTQKSKYGFIF